jgi:hypothetical protein
MNRIEENIPNTLAPTSASSTSVDLSSSSSSSSAASPIYESKIDSKTIIIILLIFFLALTLIGSTLMNILGNIAKSTSAIVISVSERILDALGYSAGTALNASSDVAADVLKTGVDLTDGAIQDVGNLLIGNENPAVKTEPEKKLEQNVQNKNSHPSPSEPSPDTSENPIQKPITSDKTNWCLIGEYQNKRGCIEISDTDKCISGQVFPSQKMCLNPTWTP